MSGNDASVAALWSDRERQAWKTPPRIAPSEWATRYYRIRRGNRKGPYRHENAPYLRGLMDIAVSPGVVQFNLRKAGQVGGSTLLRVLMAYWAHTDPAPMGLTLPNRDKGKQIMKSDVLPLFRHTPVLRELVGNPAKDLLAEGIKLLNGFELDSMWSGSASSTASNPYRRVHNDEVDKFEPWRGEDADAITSTEGRITSYEDRRLQTNTSTPTTPGGAINQLHLKSSVRLEYRMPCPHCGHMQSLIWGQLKWMDMQCAKASREAARASADAGVVEYCIRWNQAAAEWRPCDKDDDGASPMRFEIAEDMRRHIVWLERMIGLLADAEGRRGLADVLSSHREEAIWYECRECRGRIFHRQKFALSRAGRWMSEDGGLIVDANGEEHEFAEDVTMWPPETRIGASISALACMWMHWGTLVSQWLVAQDDKAALFFFVTFRLGEPFERKAKRVKANLFATKCARAPLAEGLVPRWAACLLATIDTQPDHFYCVVRAWGYGLKSARVWHGKLQSFEELDHLLYARRWRHDKDEYPPMGIRLALIDSGGTADKLLAASRTQQVYAWAIPRQSELLEPQVIAIKGASRPMVGLYGPMKNPMAGGGKIDLSDLRALMVATHRANDLLAEMIVTGVPTGKTNERDKSPLGELWQLNRRNDDEYNAHMSNMVSTQDPKTKTDIWIPRATGARHDWRHCEAYQVIAAYRANVHVILTPESVIEWKEESKRPPVEENAAGDVEYVDRFRRR